jgi:hypothetical protein
VEVSVSIEKSLAEVVETANRLGFEQWENSHSNETFYASLTLDIARFKGDTAKIKSFVRERLGLAAG